MKKKIVNKGTRLDYKSKGAYNGEYYILTKEGTLQYYNIDNEMFEECSKKSSNKTNY